VFSASESEPRPYGGAFYLEGIDAPAGWIASPVDLLRFVLGLEGQHGSKIFRVSDTFDMMVARPTPPLGAISFVGVGVRLEPRNGLPGIAEVLENGPAAQAGLRAGDIIIAVNGQPTQGKTVNEVAAMLPGPEGSSIDLTVSRGNQVLTARVVRRRIVVPHEYYAMGWKVRIDAGRMTWWHEGGLPGTAAFVVRAPEGWALAAVFNSRPSSLVTCMDLLSQKCRACSSRLRGKYGSGLLTISSDSTRDPVCQRCVNALL
jgi:membrane-associated protease RseP (regulator of RpoE activity)